MLCFADSLTGNKNEFVPRDSGKVSIYWCGPTVYDIPHLGHARSSLAFDVLVRYLKWSGYEVTAVSNITDIDDKIIERAATEGTTEPELARLYEEKYIEEMDRLDIIRPDYRPRATEYIDEMIAIIQDLVNRDMAYSTSSGVYFSVEKLDDYGALAHQSLDQLRENAGTRVEVDTEKQDPLDFALWKAAKPDEPAWESPWGLGRPGWHIECVAMSLDLLGDDFDIHGGGDDLMFPHHENERAECVGCDRLFARTWVHNGMVQVDNEKMSKSLGNFLTLNELLSSWDPRALRLLVLQTHYRRTMEINEDGMEAATAALDRLDSFERRIDGMDLPKMGPATDVIEKFRTAMDDDLGTAGGLAIIFDAVRAANSALDNSNLEKTSSLVGAVHELLAVLGISLLKAGNDGEDAEKINALVEARSKAKAAKDFVEADRIREELSNRGIILEDGPSGTTWYRN